MGELAGIPIAGLTAPTLLGVAILLLFTGKLWTNNAYQQKAQECDRWREAYEKESEARRTANQQTIELLEVTKTTHHLVEALFQNVPISRGGPNVLPKA